MKKLLFCAYYSGDLARAYQIIREYSIPEDTRREVFTKAIEIGVRDVAEVIQELDDEGELEVT